MGFLAIIIDIRFDDGVTVPYKEFFVDRPFVFAIIHKAIENNVLFYGHVMKE